MAFNEDSGVNQVRIEEGAVFVFQGQKKQLPKSDGSSRDASTISQSTIIPSTRSRTLTVETHPDEIIPQILNPEYEGDYKDGNKITKIKPHTFDLEKGKSVKIFLSIDFDEKIETDIFPEVDILRKYKENVENMKDYNPEEPQGLSIRDWVDTPMLKATLTQVEHYKPSFKYIKKSDDDYQFSKQFPSALNFSEQRVKAFGVKLPIEILIAVIERGRFTQVHSGVLFLPKISYLKTK